MVKVPVFSVEHAHVSVGGKTLFHADSLCFQPGLTAIVGPNGAGKTTLLRAAAGLAGRAHIALGDVALETLTPLQRARRIAYLPQQPVFHWPLTVSAIVGLGRYPHGADRLRGHDKTAIEAAMAAAGILDFADRPVSTLSGGERARVALARALAVEPDVLLADEPAAALDPQYHLAVFDLLRRLADKGRVVIVVTHDLNAALRYADCCAVVHAGQVTVMDTPQTALSPETLARVFSVMPHFSTHGGRPVITAFDPAS